MIQAVARCGVSAGMLREKGSRGLSQVKIYTPFFSYRAAELVETACDRQNFCGNPLANGE